MDGTVKYLLGASSSVAEAVIDNSIKPNSTPISVRPTPTPKRVKEIWAVAGGKGGVGKSLVASSLAIALSRMGNKVIAVDLDLGGANLHTTFGIDLPHQTLGDFFTFPNQKLENCIAPTGINRLELISGANDPLGAPNIPPIQKAEFLKNIRNLDADYIVFDLGAGTHFNTLDFFLASDVGIITLLPEPTSIENSYRFIKSCYYRYLVLRPTLSEARHLIRSAMNPKNPLGIKSPADLYREVTRLNPELGTILKQEIDNFRSYIIVNQTRTQADIEIGSSIKTISKKYFGIEMEYIGYLDYESSVWQAVRKKRPVMLEFPNSKIVSNIERIAQTIVKQQHLHKSKLNFWNLLADINSIGNDKGNEFLNEDS